MRRARYLLVALVAATIGLGGLGQSACRSQSPETSSAPSPAATQTPASVAQVATPTPEATAATGPSPAAVIATPSSATETVRTGTGATPTGATPTPEKPAPPRTFTLTSGRVLSVYTASPITTKTNKTGDTFTGSLSKAIVDGDWVIAKQGAPVEGVVTSSDPGGRVKGVASIAVALKSLTLADGSRVAISTGPYNKLAPTSKKKDAKKIGIGAGAGAVIGAIAGGGKGAAIGAGVGGGAGTAATLATRGDPAEIPGETLLTFRLSSPVTVTKRR
jgi:hypothetical protein